MIGGPFLTKFRHSAVLRSAGAIQAILEVEMLHHKIHFQIRSVARMFGIDFMDTRENLTSMLAIEIVENTM
jgi:hypothetical protein